MAEQKGRTKMGEEKAGGAARGRRVHELNVWAEFGDALDTEAKTFEVRKNDRDYGVGDVLRLREIGFADDDYARRHTGREWWREVTYIMFGPAFGLERDHVVLAIKPWGEEASTASAAQPPPDPPEGPEGGR